MSAARALLVGPAWALDLVRARLLVWFGRPLAPLFRDRELRVAWVGALSIGVTLAFATFAPGLLLTWGPLLLGVPHLVADGRYLVARRGLFRRPWALALVIGPAFGAWAFGSLPMAAASIVGAGLVSRASATARVALVTLGLALAWLAHRVGYAADVAFAHAHNLVAVGLWLAWPWMVRSQRRSRRHLSVVVALAAGLALLGSGALDRWAFPALFSTADVNDLIPRYSLGASPVWAVRITLLFAFAQSVHYGMWLRLLPDEDRERSAPRPFVRSVEMLAADLSWPVVLGATLLALAFLAYGARSAVAARDGYLRLALFHGPMELGLIALLVAERGARRCS